jgi:hypothetical protein
LSTRNPGLKVQYLRPFRHDGDASLLFIRKGKTTDYVARQYIGNLGKLENGLVSVNAYGVLDSVNLGPLGVLVVRTKG